MLGKNLNTILGLSQAGVQRGQEAETRNNEKEEPRW